MKKRIHICSWPKRIGKSSEVAKSNNNFLALSYFVYKWNDNPCNIYSHKSSKSDISSSSNSSSNNKNRNIDDRTTRIWNYRRIYRRTEHRSDCQRQEHIKREQTVELYMHMHQFAISFKTKIDIKFSEIQERVSEFDPRRACQSECTRTHYLGK